ncbi:hypothetical protein F4811DRAFT_549065 [Daldinia bambusicola]|nr:hypothetical protein F4811DRAFT_549065 [Daldinia bambusicola]
MAHFNSGQGGYSQPGYPGHLGPPGPPGHLVYIVCPLGNPQQVHLGSLQYSGSFTYGYPTVFCTVCRTQVPAFFQNTPTHSPYPLPVPQALATQAPYNTASSTGTFYGNNVPYPTQPGTNGWNSQSQSFQQPRQFAQPQPGQPRPASFTYNPPAKQEPCGSKQNGGSQFNINRYQNGLAVPHGTVAGQRGPGLSGFPSENITSQPPRRHSTPFPQASIPQASASSIRVPTTARLGGQSRGLQQRRRLNSDEAVGNATRTKRTSSSHGPSPASPGDIQGFSPLSDYILHTPQSLSGDALRQRELDFQRRIVEQQGLTEQKRRQGEEKEKGKGKGKEKEVKDDKIEPFTFAENGDLVLTGPEWSVPSRDEAIKEAGPTTGCSDITTIQETLDEFGNIKEVEIKENNCMGELTMSGGLSDWPWTWREEEKKQ